MDRSPLLRLPVEIRLQIYQSVFMPAPLDIARYMDPAEADVLYANQAFDTSLLLSCTGIYSEAWHIYASAYRKFWSTSNFVIDICHYELQHPEVRNYEGWTLFLDPQRVKNQVLALKTEDLEHVSSLTIRQFAHRPGESTKTWSWYALLDQRGGWIYCPHLCHQINRSCSILTRENGSVLTHRYVSEQSIRTYLSDCSTHMTMHHQILEQLRSAYYMAGGPACDPGFCANDSNVPSTLQIYDPRILNNFKARQVTRYNRHHDERFLLV